jgi:hypothetical protein
MKPLSRKVMRSSYLLQNISAGPVIAKIKGSNKKLGELSKNATVVLYSKTNLQPIAVTRPDDNGDYKFQGLNTDLICFLVGFDNNKQYNAVIQDNVVPK